MVPAFALYALKFVRPSLDPMGLHIGPGIELAFNIENSNLLTLRDVRMICLFGAMEFGRPTGEDFSKPPRRKTPGDLCRQIAASPDWAKAGTLQGDVRRLGDIPPYEGRRTNCTFAIGANVARAEVAIGVSYVLHVIPRVPWDRHICVERELLKDDAGNLQWSSPLPE